MGHYRSNVRDIEFNLFEMFGLGDHLGSGPYADLDEETVRGVLAEVDRLATGPLADSFVDGDRNPPVFDPASGEVWLPEAFRRSFQAYQDAEWWRLELPPELGGAAAPHSLHWSIGELVLGANPAIWMYSSGPSFAQLLHRIGTPQQRRLAELAIERRWGTTMVLTEPDAGSDVGAGRTRAVARPDGTWHIEGVKRFITGGDHDLTENILHYVLARPEGHGPGTKGLSMFVVPKFLVNDDGSLGERNGVQVGGVEHKMGLKVSTTCELRFGEDRPAVGLLVGDSHDGIRQMFMIIEQARMMVGTKAIATLSSGYLNALEYARNRVQGSDMTRMTDKTAPRVPITRHPDVRQMLILQKAYVEGMRALLHYTASVQDRIQRARHAGVADDAAEALNDLLLPIVKGVGSERSYELLAVSLQTLGGSGYLQDYPIEQYIRDAKIDSVYEGTTGIQGLDLFFRKIVKNDGRALSSLLGEIKGYAASEAEGGQLKEERALLGAAADDVKGIVDAMVGFTMAAGEQAEQIYRAGLNTSRLLFALGDLVIGWLLLRQADVALTKLDGAGDGHDGRAADQAFYTGKAVAARFFAATVLPRLAVERQAAEATTGDLMAVPEEAF